MKKSLCPPPFAILGAILLWSGSGMDARANVTGVITSNVDAYFGSQSDANQDRFPLSLPPTWIPVGLGPYSLTSTFLIASAPPPLGNVAPSGLTPFSGAGSFSSFFDVPGNMASSLITGFATPTIPSPIDDAQIGLSMSLTQVGAPSSYAYEQLNYSIDYSLTNTLNSAFQLTGVVGSFVSRSYNVSGTVGSSPGSYAQFGGEMNFYSVIGGVSAPLGQLTFSYLNTSPGGSFATTVTGSGIIGGGVVVNNPDFIRVTGTFYVAGDPSTITVQSVPEPSALALLGLGALGLGQRNRRRS